MDFDTVPYEDLVISKKIGGGSFGVVYKGSYLGTDIAIKEVLPSKDYDVSKYMEREWRIMREARHPNVVLFIGLSRAPDGRVFIISEFVGGGNLRTYILDRRQPFPWRLRLSFAVDIARALAYLAARQCLHRDLKGENILITGNQRCKITDFGFARIGPRNDAEKARITYCGTDGYMSPEILRGEEFDERTDIFSFGILLAEIASRRVVESGKVFGRYAPTFTLDPFEVRRLASPGCPTDLIDLALHCCQENPADRPTMPQILARLQAIEAEILARTAAGADEHVGSIRILKDRVKRPGRLENLFRSNSSDSSSDAAASTSPLNDVDMDGDGDTSNDEEEVLRMMQSGGHNRENNATSWRTATWGELPSEMLSRLARSPATEAHPSTAIAPHVSSHLAVVSNDSDMKLDGGYDTPKASTITVRAKDGHETDTASHQAREDPPADRSASVPPRDEVASPPSNIAPAAPPASLLDGGYIQLTSPTIQTHRFSLAGQAPRRPEPSTPKKRSSFQSAFHFLAPQTTDRCEHCKKRVKTRTTLQCDDCHVIVHMRCSQLIPSDCADRQRAAAAARSP